MRLDLLVHGIDLLLTMDPRRGDALGSVAGGSIGFVDDKVAWIGPAAEAPDSDWAIDGSGCIGLPGLVDCHTHAVWAGTRSDEFRRRLAGATYTEILEAGGGILSTVRATRAATTETLADLATARLVRFLDQGVTTVEVKSGYGLDAATEPRLLRAAIQAGERAGVRVIPTFLGAHAIPPEHRSDRAAYVRDVIEVQLPAVRGIAAFADVYIDRGAFTVDEGRAILTAAKAAGLGVRVHAEQIAFTGAARMAAELGATSADHLERIDDDGIAALARAGTVAVLLPGAMLYLRDEPPPVGRLRAAGVAMAVATDLNPGSSPVDSLLTCATLACVTMGLSVDEALRGITVNAGRALGRPDLGMLAVGGPGDLALLAPPPGEPCTAAALVQHLAHPSAHVVIRDGMMVIDRDGRDMRTAQS
jgi:imidazolonepropionase